MKLLTSEEHVQYDHVSRGGDNVQQHVDDTKYVMHTVGYFLDMTFTFSVKFDEFIALVISKSFFSCLKNHGFCWRLVFIIKTGDTRLKNLIVSSSESYNM